MQNVEFTELVMFQEYQMLIEKISKSFCIYLGNPKRTNGE